MNEKKTAAFVPVETQKNEYGFAKIAYDKAVENEKRIAVRDKPAAIKELTSIICNEKIEYLKGETLVKAVRFESSGGYISVKANVESKYETSAEIVLNGKSIGKREKGGTYPYEISARTKDGENLLYVVIENAIPEISLSLSVTGQIKEIKGEERINFLDKNLFSVTVGDTLAVYAYDSGSDSFVTKYYLCGLKTCSAAFDKDNYRIYVSGKLYSGARFIYRLDPDDPSTICSVNDHQVNYVSATLAVYNGNVLFYYVMGNALKCAFIKDDDLDELNYVKRGVTEVTASHTENGGVVFLKNSYGVYAAYYVSYVLLNKPQVVLGRVYAPQMCFMRKAVLYKNGDKDSEAGTCEAEISNKRICNDKLAYLQYPVTETEGSVVGLSGGKPVILGKITTKTEE